jgi:hypothetical protein
METSNLEEAKAAINKLLDTLGITRIICVDDVYIQSVAFEDALGSLEELSVEQAQTIIGEGTIRLSPDPDIRTEQFRDYWDSLPNDQKPDLFQRLSGEKDEQATPSGFDAQDLDAANMLESLLVGREFYPKSLTAWKKQRKQYFEEARTQKTLFLFDENLTRDGGAATGGRTLIREVLALEQTKSSMCGLLSHNIRPESEYDIWGEFTGPDYEFDPDRVIPVSKSHLQNNPLTFAQRIKLTILNPHCKQLRSQASRIISQAQKEAQKKIDLISVYDFEHIVFKASNKEGLWEPDTLFRLYGLFQRLEARQKAKGNRKLHNLSAIIRSVSAVPIEGEMSSVNECGAGGIKNASMAIAPIDTHLQPQRPWAIQRLELYENAEYLNGYHLPIELGDIFEKTSGPKKKKGKYILIAQPCDLMVRTDSGKRRAVITEGVLAKIVDDLPKDKKTGIPKQQDMHYELRYFDTSSGKSHYVSFLETHQVKLYVLDLCVFREDGEAKISIKDIPSKNMVPAWGKYHGKILENAKEIIENYSKLQKMREQYNKRRQPQNQASDKLLRLAIPQSSDPELFVGTIDSVKNILSYDCKRVERLCQAHAAALLTKYSNFTSRAAFDLDFGR